MPHSVLVRCTLALIAFSLVASAASASRVVVLVRHAEKESDGTRNPVLTAAGRARAEALAQALSAAKVTAVVTSPYRRTQQTGAPTAALFELEPVVAAMTRESGLKGHVDAAVAAVRAAPEGVVLVVGHSNTVPAILAALGGPELPDLDESDNASLFTLVTADEGEPWLIRSELSAAVPLPWNVNDPCPDVEFPAQDSSPYLLPYPVGERRNVRQGNCNSSNSHHAGYGARFAYDFEMPIGSKITAARAGKVLALTEKYRDDQHGLSEGNFIAIDHGDGSYAMYGHLTKDGALAKVGESVLAGQVIALSGNSGLSRGPHLHFGVKACPEGDKVGGPTCKMVPVTFRNTRAHPRGLIGSATSEIGGGEWYAALPLPN